MKTKLNKDKIQKIIEYSIICFYLSKKTVCYLLFIQEFKEKNNFFFVYSNLD